MRRRVTVSGLAAISRAIGGGGTSAISVTHPRLPQRALCGASYSTTNCNLQWLSSPGLADCLVPSGPSVVNGVAGTRFLSAAATSAAKEAPRPEKFSPKDVVLYQYEACPFCNKVKGKIESINSQLFLVCLGNECCSVIVIGLSMKMSTWYSLPLFSLELVTCFFYWILGFFYFWWDIYVYIQTHHFDDSVWQIFPFIEISILMEKSLAGWTSH